MDTLKNEAELAKYLYENREVIIKYHTDKDCPNCEDMVPVYQKLSESPKYKNIKFAIMHADDNPLADRLIKGKKMPYAATYKNSILVESRTLTSEEDLIRLLESLPNVKLIF